MATKTLEQRLHYIDHLRGFMFILMAIDHALHAYAEKWGFFWFFWDEKRTPIFDAFYVHNQAIIMPMLFFIFGMFVLPSLKHRGFFSYVKERFFRLGLIYIFGITFLVPLLSYPKYEQHEEPGISYLEFWRDIFFHERFQAGPMWVLHGILGFTLLLIGIYYFTPPLYRLITRFFQKCAERPVYGYMVFGLMSAIILFISDILWGAPWWTNFGWIFSLQSSRMILIFVYFLAGSALMQSGLLHNSTFLKMLTDNLYKIAILYLALAFGFMFYTTSYYDSTYNEVIMRTARASGGWFSVDTSAWMTLILKYAPPILLRTTLHGFLCLTQALLLLAVFHKYFSKPTALWTSLARNAFGIFILHETIVVWLQYYFNETSIPMFVKFFTCVLIGISLSWLISAKFLLKVPILERILSPKPKEIA